ncbi:MAG: hypothetical protein AB1665_00250 [Candidatus Thermoplasmatota archaeon]
MGERYMNRHKSWIIARQDITELSRKRLGLCSLVLTSLRMALTQPSYTQRIGDEPCPMPRSPRGRAA